MLLLYTVQLYEIITPHRMCMRCGVLRRMITWSGVSISQLVSSCASSLQKPLHESRSCSGVVYSCGPKEFWFPPDNFGYWIRWHYAVVDGGWSSWSAWTQCSVSCGAGLKARDRLCNRPAPHYGLPCNGSARQVHICDDYPCPGLAVRDTLAFNWFKLNIRKFVIDSIFEEINTA